jgi:hypothetical protein
MRIKKGDWIIDTKTLFRFEFRKGLPKLIVHEKYEKAIKWILRILTFIGIVTSIISLPWQGSLALSIFLFLIEQFFEKILFEYTTIVVQPFPKFNIDGTKWKTNGFAMTEVKNPDSPPYIGPAFDDEKYARDFWEYIKSWNNIDKEDSKNDIVLSFVIEPDDTYTTFIYANLHRKNLDSIFNKAERLLRLDKFGKQQQQLVMQMFLAHNLIYRNDLKIAEFLKTYSSTDKFVFTPFVQLPDGKIKILNGIGFTKFEYKIKKRDELTKYDPEYRIRQNKTVANTRS